jgi:metallophosphoesterase superfamily enzyme
MVRRVDNRALAPVLRVVLVTAAARAVDREVIEHNPRPLHDVGLSGHRHPIVDWVDAQGVAERWVGTMIMPCSLTAV